MILVSACLLGCACRYDGQSKPYPLAQELAKLGVRVDAEENRVTVHPGGIAAPREVLDGHNDHRIVMALSVLATSVGGTICGAEAVAKSYPDFFEVLQALGIRAEIRP